MTLATPRVVPVRRVKVLVWRKVVSAARVTLPAEVTQLVHPGCLAPPRQLGVIHNNGCLNYTTIQGKVISPGVTRGEACLGYPRPYKWGLRSLWETALRYWRKDLKRKDLKEKMWEKCFWDFARKDIPRSNNGRLFVIAGKSGEEVRKGFRRISR